MAKTSVKIDLVKIGLKLGKISAEYKVILAARDKIAIGLAIILAVQVIRPVYVQTALAADAGSQATAYQGEILAPAEDVAAVETVEEPVEAPATVQDELLAVCRDGGYGEDCGKVLLGIMWKESRNVGNAVGDRGQARGYFQIWYRLHKISIECAEDLRCSADWTLNYLERNGYPRYVNYAVQCHNGCNIDNGYAASVLRHGRRLWNTPLPVVKPTRVAMKN